MAEIKSTLDLIMEKTKNLSLTPEERNEIRMKDLQAKVKGWTQRYVDGLVDIASVRKHLSGMKEEKTIALDFFRKSALSHIAPEGDNARILRFLQEILNEDIASLVQRIAAFNSKMEKRKARFINDAMHELEQKGIRGSSVIPHVDQYPEWQAWRAAALDAFRQSLGVKEEVPDLAARRAV